MAELCVLGAGAWGTALAVHAQRLGHAVTLWARREALARRIATERQNPDYLPGVALDQTVTVTSDLAETTAPVVLAAVPAQALRAVCAAARAIPDDAAVVVCAKGIEVATGALMSEVVEATLPGRTVAVLSGPTFAAEVARALPTAVTLACADAGAGARLVDVLGSATFRPYLTDDVIGAECGGAVKNVLAIACGIAAGRGFGENARAALITRGLAEIGRLSAALGGRPETLMGLSGVGDVTLTCTSVQSRNYALGVALGEGAALSALLSGGRTIAEGVPTAAALSALADKLGVEMPISAAVNAVLHEGADLSLTIEAVLARPFRAEVGAAL